MSCTKAQGFLEVHDVKVEQQSDAKKECLGRDEALSLAKQASAIVIAKGKKVVVFDLKESPPDDDALLLHLLGPTGNLRAPAIRKGKTLLVGFNDEAYQHWLTK